MLTIYTDGSCWPNPGPGGWAWARLGDTDPVECSGWHPSTTNNRMEMEAIISALQHLPHSTPAMIYSDSMLCINTLTTWAASWERRGWTRHGKHGQSNEVKNLDLVQLAWSLVKQQPFVRFEHVRGHTGNYWNEYVDRLASAARIARTPAVTLPCTSAEEGPSHAEQSPAGR